MTKFIFGTALAVLALALPGAASAQRAPDPVIVIVDRQRVANECNACRTAATTLQGMMTSFQQRQQQLSQPLQTEATSIQQAADALQRQPASPARTTAEAQLQTRARAFTTRQTTAEQELQRLETNIQSTRANVQRQIIEKLDPIVAIVMKARNANIAVDASVTISFAPGLEVTSDVLAQLNTALPSLSITPLPQQPAPGAAAPPAAQPPGR